MTDVLIVNPPSPDGHVYIRDMCRWGRKSREKMVWPQSSLAYLAAMVPDGMSVRIIDAIAEEMSLDAFLEEIRKRTASILRLLRHRHDLLRGRPRGSGGQATGSDARSPSAPTSRPCRGNTLELIPELDYVIRHEPEFTFREIIDRVCGAVDGRLHRNGPAAAPTARW